VQDDASRNDQDEHPVQRKDQRDPAQRDRHADIERIAGAPKYAIGDQRGRRPQRIDVGAMPQQRAVAGRHGRHARDDDQRAKAGPQALVDICDQSKRHQPLQYAGDRERGIRNHRWEDDEIRAIERGVSHGNSRRFERGHFVCRRQKLRAGDKDHSIVSIGDI
jgi:hypothetical protein